MEKNKQLQEEIDRLRQQLENFKDANQIYVPDAKDPLDNQLAEYINNYSDRSKLRIMFMKESEGVYHFGSRRVYVKVEKNKIVGKSKAVTLCSKSRRWLSQH